MCYEAVQASKYAINLLEIQSATEWIFLHQFSYHDLLIIVSMKQASVSPEMEIDYDVLYTWFIFLSLVNGMLQHTQQCC